MLVWKRIKIHKIQKWPNLYLFKISRDTAHKRRCFPTKAKFGVTKDDPIYISIQHFPPKRVIDWNISIDRNIKYRGVKIIIYILFVFFFISIKIDYIVCVFARACVYLFIFRNSYKERYFLFIKKKGKKTLNFHDIYYINSFWTMMLMIKKDKKKNKKEKISKRIWWKINTNYFLCMIIIKLPMK